MTQGRPKGGMSEFTRNARERIKAEQLVDNLISIAQDKDATNADRISATRTLLDRCMPILKSQELTIDNAGNDITPDEQLFMRQQLLLFRQMKEAGEIKQS